MIITFLSVLGICLAFCVFIAFFIFLSGMVKDYCEYKGWYELATWVPMFVFLLAISLLISTIAACSSVEQKTKVPTTQVEK